MFNLIIISFLQNLSLDSIIFEWIGHNRNFRIRSGSLKGQQNIEIKVVPDILNINLSFTVPFNPYLHSLSFMNLQITFISSHGDGKLRIICFGSYLNLVFYQVPFLNIKGRGIFISAWSCLYGEGLEFLPRNKTSCSLVDFYFLFLPATVEDKNIKLTV